MLHGMVFKKEAEGDVTSVKDAKIAVYSCPFDSMVTETKVMNTVMKRFLRVIWNFILWHAIISISFWPVSHDVNLFIVLP